MECVLVWVVFSSLAVEDGFLLITDKSFTKLSDPRQEHPERVKRLRLQGIGEPTSIEPGLLWAR